MEDFLFVDLAGLTPGKPFAGFAAGSFTDMHGREVEFEPGALAAFTANTLKAIGAAKKKGMPGLPIDAKAHDKGAAAGWVVDATEGTVEDSDGNPVPVIMFTADWTEVGQDLLSKRIMANFSPTVDLRRKVVRGGSLTNWPATVDEAGAPLFPAVELAQGIHTYAALEENEDEGSESEDEPAEVLPEVEVEAVETVSTGQGDTAGDKNQSNHGELSMEITKDELSALVASQVKAALAEAVPTAPPATSDGGDETDLLSLLNLTGFDDGMIAKLSEQMSKNIELAKARALKDAAEKYTRLQHEAEVAEFAQVATGGSADIPYGLPVSINDLKEFLGRLSPTDYEFAKKLLGDIQQHGRTKYAELGHGKNVQALAALPTEYAQALDRGELTVKDLSDPVLALGDVAQYDLSRWNNGGK